MYFVHNWHILRLGVYLVFVMSTHLGGLPITMTFNPPWAISDEIVATWWVGSVLWCTCGQLGRRPDHNYPIIIIVMTESWLLWRHAWENRNNRAVWNQNTLLSSGACSRGGGGVNKGSWFGSSIALFLRYAHRYLFHPFRYEMVHLFLYFVK